MSLQHRGPNICVETFSSVPCPCYMGRRNWGRQSWEVAGCQGCHRHDWWRLTTLLASFTIVSVVVCCLLFVGLCMFIFLFVGFLLTCTHEIGNINRCWLTHPSPWYLENSPGRPSFCIGEFSFAEIPSIWELLLIWHFPGQGVLHYFKRASPVKIYKSWFGGEVNF